MILHNTKDIAIIYIAVFNLISFIINVYTVGLYIEDNIKPEVLLPAVVVSMVMSLCGGIAVLVWFTR